MDLDEIERRTHEQIRELQEEYRKRVEPLNKILYDIEMARPQRPIFLSLEDLYGVSPLDDPRYREAQRQVNKAYRDLIDKMPGPNQ